MNRPRTCLDLACSCLKAIGNNVYIDEGGSYFCWGRLEKESIYPVKSAVHKNGYSMCIYTPAKGIIRFFMNANDAEILKIGSDVVLEDIQSLATKVNEE